MSDQDSIPHPEPSTPENPPGEGRSLADPYIEDYLDRVYAPLVGVIPYTRRRDLIDEMRSHLYELVQTRREEGAEEEEALREAFRQFGPPRRIARAWIEAESIPWTRRQGWLASLLTFGGAALVAFLMVASPYSGGEDWFQRRNLGYADIWAGLVLPLFAAILLGYHARARVYLTSFFVLSAMILVASLLYLADLPSGASYGGFSSIYEFFAVVLGLYWILLAFIGIGIGTAFRRLVRWARLTPHLSLPYRFTPE
ncbi:MAG: permease prefix domain 1-containing protein [Armatimonadetes bacterium]|nr:permease prefix domain 1-containing protein [Armatimonadota bacterium]